MILRQKNTVYIYNIIYIYIYSTVYKALCLHRKTKKHVICAFGVHHTTVVLVSFSPKALWPKPWSLCLPATREVPAVDELTPNTWTLSAVQVAYFQHNLSEWVVKCWMVEDPNAMFFKATYIMTLRTYRNHGESEILRKTNLFLTAQNSTVPCAWRHIIVNNAGRSIRSHLAQHTTGDGHSADGCWYHRLNHFFGGPSLHISQGEISF